jgi:hypothetical protein
LELEGGLALLDGAVVFAEESHLLIVLLVEAFVINKKLFVFVQLLQFGADFREEGIIYLLHESLDELLPSLYKDVIAVVLHLLADIVDDIRVQLIKLAELPESPLDYEGQSQQEVFVLL